MKFKIKNIKIHPISEKLLKKGHPWITRDKFSENFPKEEIFLNLEINKKIYTLINDPTHKKIKARLFKKSDTPLKTKNDLLTELRLRFENSFSKRKELNLNRENIYLSFSEADFLPGIYILKLGEILLIQYYTLFYKRFEKDIESIIVETYTKVFNEKIKEKFCQYRISSQQKKIGKPYKFQIYEFNLKYEIEINQFYDLGIYTDMSSIREQISGKLFGDVLNLYSYTGAYSLVALLKKCNVKSVDLSKKYLNWLDRNLKLNDSKLNLNNHESICMPVDKYIDLAVSENTFFDFIICDPPSASTDGKKKTNAFKNYESLLPKLNKVLKKSGFLLIFLNTHQISQKKFELKIRDIISPLNMKIVDKYKLSQDCPTFSSFPEGNYLKGILIKKS